MPSSTETYLCDRFTAQEQGFYLGVEDKKAWVVPLPCLATCESHIYLQTAARENTASNGGSTIQFLTYPLMIRFTLLFSCLYTTTATQPPRLAKGHGEDWQRRRANVREGRQKEGGGALLHHRVMSSSGPDRCFLIFSCCADKWLIVSLDKGTVFPVMGIRGRRKSLRQRVRLNQ